MNDIALEYMRSLNPISKGIVDDIIVLKNQRQNCDDNEFNEVIHKYLIIEECDDSDFAEIERSNGIDLDDGILHHHYVNDTTSARSTMTEVYDGHSGPFTWRSRSQEDLRIFEPSSHSYLSDIKSVRKEESCIVLRPNPFVVEGNTLDSGCPSSQESKRSSYVDLDTGSDEPNINSVHSKNDNVRSNEYVHKIRFNQCAENGDSQSKIDQTKLQKSLLKGLEKYSVKDVAKETFESRKNETKKVKQTKSVAPTLKKSDLQHINAAFVPSVENLQMNANQQFEEENGSYKNSNGINQVTRDKSMHSKMSEECGENLIEERDDEERRNLEMLEDKNAVLSEEEDQRLLDSNQESSVPHSGFDFLDNW